MVHVVTLCGGLPQILERKVAFNKEFDKLARQKRSDADKVADLNSRMEETARDLAKLGVQPSMSPQEMSFHVSCYVDEYISNAVVLVVTVLQCLANFK